MEDGQDFTPITKSQSRFHRGTSLRGKVIKKERIQVSDPLKIKPITVHHDHPSEEMIEPIIEDGIVVGLYFTCVCGRTSEIRFELDHSN